MRPAARMPKLTRRSRILIGVALAVVLLLLFGPRMIDAYVDWLWFGELGYRSVFTTQILTRIVVGLVAVISHRHGTFPITKDWFSLSGIGGHGSLTAGFLVALFAYAGWDGTVYHMTRVKRAKD